MTSHFFVNSSRISNNIKLIRYSRIFFSVIVLDYSCCRQKIRKLCPTLQRSGFKFPDLRIRDSRLVSARVKISCQYQRSCSGNTKRMPINTNPTTIPMTQMLDLIFDFHMYYTLLPQVLLLFLAALMRNQLTFLFLIN